MGLWTLIVLACLVQESASTNAVLLSAYQAHMPLYAVHATYVLGTVVDILISYGLGLLVRRHYPQSRIIRWVQRASARIQESIGRRGEIVGMFILGVVNFVYLDAFVFAWLPFSFREVFTLLFIGDMVAYAVEWAFVLGVHTVLPGRTAGFAAIFGVAVLGAIASWYMHRKSRAAKH